MTGTLHGHSLHFLERLSRASGESSELALELYHTPEILRWVLGRIRIPEDRERVALSLDPGDAGPFLVATRAGAFVTCLGRDMKPTGLHLVAHGQLLAHRRDWLADRERMALGAEIRGTERGADHILFEILHQGLDVSREEFIAASALQVVMKRHYIKSLAEFSIEAWTFFRRMSRGKILQRTGDDSLHAFWKTHWNLGHLALLASMDGPRDLEDWAASGLATVLFDVFRWGEETLCARALWGLGRMGRPALKVCRRMLREAEMDMDWLAAVLGIAVIGMRHARLAAEARRLLESPPRPQERVGDAAAYYDLLGAEALALIRAAMDHPEAIGEVHSRISRNIAVWIAGEMKLDAPFDFSDPEDVPEDLARAVTTSWEYDLRKSERRIEAFVQLLPWLARCEAAELYPPRAWTEAARRRWIRGFSEHLINNGIDYWGRDGPLVAEARPGRNDPCPCGSGKKYKKCCLRSGG
jgi:hypothetical protein